MIKNHQIGRILLAGLLAGILTMIFYYRNDLKELDLAGFLEDIGMIAPFLFIGAYALSTPLFFPGLLLTVTGGAVFGLWWGTVYNIVGATLGATLAFLASRYIVGDWVEKKATGKLAILIQGVEKEGWRFVAFTRLVPLFPFNLLNYALGLTRIRLSSYIPVSFITMLPACFVYTYLGQLGKDALAGTDSLYQTGQKVLLALAIFAVILFIPRLIWKGKKLTGKS